MKCKNVVPSTFSKSVPTNVNQNLGNFPQMPFLPNPFYIYGNSSMTPMLWGNHNVNNPFAYIYILKMKARIIYGLKFLISLKAKDLPLR